MKLTDLITVEKPISNLWKMYSAKIGFIQATGKTSEDATAQVVKDVKRALSGEYYPITIVHKGWLAVIYRHPRHIDVWEYTVQKIVDGTKTHYATSTVGDMYDTERACRTHLASYLSDEMPIEDASEVIENSEDRRDWLDWNRKVQAAMKLGKEEGIEFFDALRLLETGKR